MRSRDPRNTWRIGALVVSVGCAYKAGRSGRVCSHEAKPDVIKGPFRKRGGCAMKVVGLTRGDLRGCSGMPGHAWRARRVGRDGDAREGVARRGEVSRGRITSGIDCRWEGPNAKPRCRTLVLVGWTLTAANPKWGLAREGQRVKPEDHRSERSPSPARGDTAPHPAEASLWEQFLARENLAEALRRVERNAGAPGIDGMSESAGRNRHGDADERAVHRRSSDSRWPRPCVGDPRGRSEALDTG